MKTAAFKPGCLATAVGSMPHTDPQEACSLIMDTLPEIPAWPQLPKRSYLENMYIQYTEGFPGAVLTEEGIYIDRSIDYSSSKSLEELYTAYVENNIDKYAISPEYASGLRFFLSQKLNSALAVKGQVTGPISFGLAITDQERLPTLYDDTLGDAMAKHLRLKASWMEKELAKLSSNTIVFVDEPYLASLGSAFSALRSDMVINLINEVLGGLNGVKGMHCCGNTDWSVLMQTDIDILNLDAYNYGEAITLYPEAVESFLNRGGVIAWGIVPNEENALDIETAETLLARLHILMDSLSSKGIGYEMLLERCLITPACGLGTISTEGAAKALKLTAQVSREFRRWHGFYS